MKIRSVVFTGILLGLSGAIMAEDLILDGQEIPLAAGSSVSINPVTGDITATSADGNLVCTDPGAVTVGTLGASPNPVAQGNQLSMSWSSANATGCTPMGSLPGWSSANIGTQGPFTFTVNASPNTYTASVQCSNGSSSDTSNTVNVTVEEADPDAPTITNWQATSATTIEAGDSVTFDWSSQDAVTCEGSGNLPGWNGIQQTTQGPGTADVPAQTSPSTYSARLTCQNASGSTTTNSISVTVQEGTILGCEDREPPDGMTRDNTVLYNSGATTITWQAFFGVPFPQGNLSRVLDIDANQYASLEFTTGSSVPEEYRIVFDEAQAGGLDSSPKVISFSQCPGDFWEPEDDEDCRWFDVRASAIRFGADDSFVCALEPNTTYYLNITYSDEMDNFIPGDGIPDGNIEWFCDGNDCGNRMNAPNG